MPTRERLIPTLLIMAMAPFVVAGCGGGDDPEPPPAPTEQPTEPATLTKADLISQGDGICAEVNAAIGTIDGSTTIAESAKVTQRADLYAGLADRLEDLGRPDDGDPPTEVIAALRELGEAGGDAGATGAETEPVPTTDPTAFQDAAAAYGFTECAEAPAAPSPTGTGEGYEAGGEEAAPVDPGAEGTYTEPAPAAPEAEPAPPVDTGGVNPDTGSGGSSGGSEGSSGGGGSSGGIGPG